MIGLCQITNWISSHWRRQHFLCPHSYHWVQTPLSLNHHSDKLSTHQLCKVMLYFSSFVRTPHLYSSCWLGRICSNLLMFFSLKVSMAGEGLLVNTLMMPMGNDKVISPVIFTMHLLNVATWIWSMSEIANVDYFFDNCLSKVSQKTVRKLRKMSVTISQCLKLTSSDHLFCLTNCPKPKNILFLFNKRFKKYKILTYKKVEPKDVWPFYQEKDNYQNYC